MTETQKVNTIYFKAALKKEPPARKPIFPFVKIAHFSVKIFYIQNTFCCLRFPTIDKPASRTNTILHPKQQKAPVPPASPLPTEDLPGEIHLHTTGIYLKFICIPPVLSEIHLHIAGTYLKIICASRNPPAPLLIAPSLLHPRPAFSLVPCPSLRPAFRLLPALLLLPPVFSLVSHFLSPLPISSPNVLPIHTAAYKKAPRRRLQQSSHRGNKKRSRRRTVCADSNRKTAICTVSDNILRHQGSLPAAKAEPFQKQSTYQKQQLLQFQKILKNPERYKQRHAVSHSIMQRRIKTRTNAGVRPSRHTPTESKKTDRGNIIPPAQKYKV